MKNDWVFHAKEKENLVNGKVSVSCCAVLSQEHEKRWDFPIYINISYKLGKKSGKILLAFD
jgi:hypothetical protein